MLVIRLARHGRNKYPVYRIVAADQRRAATSKFVAILGSYNPHTKEIKLDVEKIEMYMGNGAQASDRVLRLLKAEGVKLPAWAKTHDRNKPSKQEVEEKPEEAKGEDGSEPSTESAAEGVETAEATAEATEEKAVDQKTDVGTAKEADEAKEQADAQDKAADAATEEAKEEK